MAMGENFVMLEPAKGSLGAYGIDGTANDFVEEQGVGAYLGANSALLRRCSRSFVIESRRRSMSIESSRASTAGAPFERRWPSRTTTRIR